MSIQALEVETFDQQLLLLRDKINQITISSAYTGKVPTIGVIAKKHSSLGAVASLLNSYNIPIKYEKSDNILEYNHIKWIIQIMRYCLEYNQSTNHRDLDYLVQEIISYPFWGINPITLFDLATQTNSLQRQNKELSYLVSMLEYTPSQLAIQTIGADTSGQILISSIANWLINLGTNSPNLSLGQILDVILGVEISDSNGIVNIRTVDEDYE
ncbi:MAG: hypothetical protein H7230_01575 [Candidatus Parcubacteria bacterium]|nr:hypothetical protein [Candidatus Paceibacterota bacterium]